MVRYIYILGISFNLWLKSMGSIWLSKKAFLYFGGAAVILIGGAIILMAPYHYINFAVDENQQRVFNIWERDGYYPQIEISVSTRYVNTSDVFIDLLFDENTTQEAFFVNFTMDDNNIVEAQDLMFLKASMVLDIPHGNYTITIYRIEGAGSITLGLEQVSDSRAFILTGGIMNILGLIMGISGYFVPGTFLPTDTDIIVDWGFDDEEKGV
jgi:hypothetical protein